MLHEYRSALQFDGFRGTTMYIPSGALESSLVFVHSALVASPSQSGRFSDIPRAGFLFRTAHQKAGCHTYSPWPHIERACAPRYNPDILISRQLTRQPAT